MQTHNRMPQQRCIEARTMKEKARKLKPVLFNELEKMRQWLYTISTHWRIKQSQQKMSSNYFLMEESNLNMVQECTEILFKARQTIIHCHNNIRGTVEFQSIDREGYAFCTTNWGTKARSDFAQEQNRTFYKKTPLQ